jgi:hypothetical protein
MPENLRAREFDNNIKMDITEMECALVNSALLLNPLIPCIFVQLHTDPTKCTTFII